MFAHAVVLNSLGEPQLVVIVLCNGDRRRRAIKKLGVDPDRFIVGRDGIVRELLDDHLK